MPGVFVPAEERESGRLLVDGGVVDPVPLDVLVEAGVEIQIGVNILRKTRYGGKT